MTEKELHKLRRQDLLELLLTQSRNAAQQQAEIDSAAARLTELTETLEKQTEKLDAKDAQIVYLIDRLKEEDARIQLLKSRLEEKDEMIRELRELLKVNRNTRNALSLEELLEVGYRAAEEYLKRKETEQPGDGVPQLFD